MIFRAGAPIEILAGLLIAVLCLGAGWLAAQVFKFNYRFEHSKSGWCRSFRVAVVSMTLLVFFTPSLMVSYIYRQSPVYLVMLRDHHLLLNELFYIVLLMMKFTPLAMAYWIFGRFNRLDDRAMKIWRMSGHDAGICKPPGVTCNESLQLWWWRGGNQFMVGVSLFFLLVFAEFELASRLDINNWPVRSFDLHRASQNWGLAWQAAWPYILAQWVCVLFIALMYWRADYQSGHAQGLTSIDTMDSVKHDHGLLFFRMLSGAAWVLISFLVITVYPALVLYQEGLPAIRQFYTGMIYAGGYEGYLASAIIGTLAVAMISMGMFFFNLGSGIWHQWRWCIALLFALPGLMGALPLALMLMKLVNTPGLYWLRGTPLVASIGVALILWPIALILSHQIRHGRSSTAVHVNQLLRFSNDTRQRMHGRSIRWKLVMAPLLIWFMVLWSLAWFDVLMGSLLAPLGMQPVFAEMYGLVHYGRNNKMSVDMAMAILFPALLAPFLWLLLSFGYRKVYR